MVGSEHPLKISAPKPLRFGIDSVLKILNKRITKSLNEEEEEKKKKKVTPDM